MQLPWSFFCVPQHSILPGRLPIIYKWIFISLQSVFGAGLYNSPIHVGMSLCSPAQLVTSCHLPNSPRALLNADNKSVHYLHLTATASLSFDKGQVSFDLRRRPLDRSFAATCRRVSELISRSGISEILTRLAAPHRTSSNWQFLSRRYHLCLYRLCHSGFSSEATPV